LDALELPRSTGEKPLEYLLIATTAQPCRLTANLSSFFSRRDVLELLSDIEESSIEPL
jgi:hypothetical protein